MIEPFQYQPSKLSRKHTPSLQSLSSPINPSFRKDPDQDPWNDYIPDEFLVSNSENLDPTNVSSLSQKSQSNAFIKKTPFQPVDCNKDEEKLVERQEEMSFSKKKSSNNSVNTTGAVKPVSFQKAYKVLAQQMLDRQLNETNSQLPSNSSKLGPSTNLEGLLLGPKQIEELETHGERQERAKIEVFTQKLEAQAVKAQQKREALVSEVLNHQLRDCTFSPNVQDAEKTRSFTQFLQGQQAFQSKLEAKKQALREAEERRQQETVKCNPTINARSRKIAEIRTPQNNSMVFDRLYSHNSTRAHSQNNNQGLMNDNSHFFPEDPRLFQTGLAEVPEVDTSVNQNGESGTTNRPFMPEINQKSKQLVRAEKIEDILYRDAKRRQVGVSNTNTAKKRGNSLKSQSQVMRNPFSDKLIIQRFIKDFEAAVVEVTKDPKKELTDFLDYLSMNEVLRCLGFISYACSEENSSIQGIHAQERALISELWNILKGEQNNGVSKRNLCVFLLAVLGLYWTEGENEEAPSDNSAFRNQDQARNLGQFNEKGDIELHFEDCRLIHSTFELFYRTRLSYENLKKVRKSNTMDDSKFQPEISETSKVLAEHYRERLLEEFANIINTQTIPELKVPENGALTHTDLLVLQKKTQVLQHEKKKQERKVEELKNCPFKPNINQHKSATKHPHNAKSSKPRFLELYDLAKTRPNKRDRAPEEIDFERNVEHCTFKPEIMNPQKRSVCERNGEFFARDIDKTVERMRNARKEREFVKLWTERGIVLSKRLENVEDSASNIEKFRGISSSSRITRLEEEKDAENGVQNQEEQFREGIQSNIDNNDPEIENSIENNRIPLLYVDVNLGANRTERIVVFEGDESEELAERFVQEHGLDSNMKFKLKDLLDAQIAGVLTRIEEERASLNSDSEFNHQMK